jgi:hypothetical protein
MNRKTIWDRLTDLELVQGAIDELASYPDDDLAIVSIRAFLVQLKKRIQTRDKEGGK